MLAKFAVFIGILIASLVSYIHRCAICRLLPLKRMKRETGISGDKDVEEKLVDIQVEIERKR